MTIVIPKYFVRFLGGSYLASALGGPFLVFLLIGVLSAIGMHLGERQSADQQSTNNATIHLNGLTVERQYETCVF